MAQQLQMLKGIGHGEAGHPGQLIYAAFALSKKLH